MAVPPRRKSLRRENIVDKQKVKRSVWITCSSVLGYVVLHSYRAELQTASDLLAWFKNPTVRSCLLSIIFPFRDSN